MCPLTSEFKDASASDPALDTKAFPTPSPITFWSSAKKAAGNGDGYIGFHVNFAQGYTYFGGTKESCAVRRVRN